MRESQRWTSSAYILRCVASRRLRWAGRAGPRLNDKESLMVHWGRPTTPAMALRHKLQLALLLEMDKNVRHNTPLEWMCATCCRVDRGRVSSW